MIQFTIMNAFNFILWLIISIVAGKDIPLADDSAAPETLTLKLKLKGVVTIIQLKSIHRVLANEFLPVWITTDTPGMAYSKFNIMSELGQFTTYYDDCTKSAFVYFHKTHELNGIINIRYYIKKYPIDGMNKVHEVQPEYVHRIEKNDQVALRLPRSIANTTLCRERRFSKLNMYPELLVAISHDTFTAIEKDSTSPRGIETVAHILTVYNAADMLYKSLPSANIQLNIAGIIIESESNKWHFESGTSDSEIYIDVDSVHPTISNYFWYYEYYFPQHSYDIIVYHTRNPLKDDTNEIILGQATPALDGYLFPIHHREDRLNAIVKDFETYEHYVTIAHELAHIFGAAHDGTGSYGHFFDTSCGDSLMSEYRGCQKSCFKWSQQTQKEFAAFFRTPAYCNMKNYPRSLDAPKPKVIFSVNEQCECYGHQSKLWVSSQPGVNFGNNKCNKPLMCTSNNHEEVEVPLPMDGTPCGSRRVCWNKVCAQYPKMRFNEVQNDDLIVG